MKDIKQIQEYNRRKIICAVHGTDDYEEALEKDFIEATSQFTLFIGYKGGFDDVQKWLRTNGKPLVLDRILLALTDVDYWIEPCGTNLVFSYQDSDGICKQLFIWDLTKPTLEEQTKETQMAIYKLLGGA